MHKGRDQENFRWSRRRWVRAHRDGLVYFVYVKAYGKFRISQLDTDNLKKQITKIFDYFDEDGSGLLDEKKIKRMINECFFNIDDEGIKKMLDSADTDGSGKISKY